MPVNVLKQAPIAGIAVPIIATLALVGIVLAPRAVGDNAPALLLDFVPFASTLNIGDGLSPAAARDAGLEIRLKDSAVQPGAQ